MKKIILLLALNLLVSLSYSQNSVYKISSIKAYLFYNTQNSASGKNITEIISKNIIDNPSFSLWNTIIGEGSAKGSSSQTLVSVRIKEENDTPQERLLKIICKSAGKIILTKIHNLSNYSENKYYTYAVLLDDIGCEKIQITAEIINEKSNKIESKMIKTIDFACGE